MMKRNRLWRIVLLGAMLFCSCGNGGTPSGEATPSSESVRTFSLPNVTGYDEATAKTYLAAMALLPTVTYDYSETVAEGKVIKTSPKAGSSVSEDTAVTIYVSLGKAYMDLDGSGSMSDIEGVTPFSWGDDGNPRTKNLNFPYFNRGRLYFPMWLKCTSTHEITFPKDGPENKTAKAEASLTSDFKTVVDAVLSYESYKVANDGTITRFTFRVSCEDLGKTRPSAVYMRCNFFIDGEPKPFNVSMNLIWPK